MKVVLSALFLLFGAVPSRAGDMDLRGWLDRPGTRLLAVEFYATWCEPCMKAVPRWKALHEKYRSRGLRLVVVSTLDPEGQCVNPGWMPDETVCDTEGKIAEAFGLGGKLPAAFLWSWQGNLLVSHGHVDEAERAIEAYLQKSPRLILDGSTAGTGLVDLVREQLTARDKLTLLAGSAEAAELEKVKKRSFEARFDDRLQCELGQELSANSLLRVSLSGQKPARLSLMLFSAESGCLLAAGTAPYVPESARAAAAEAVDKLLSRLRADPQLPGARPDTVAKKKQSDRRQAELWLEFARASRGEPELRQRALDKALALDPDLAAAHAERADELWSRNLGNPGECYEGPEKQDACFSLLREKKKSLKEALAALDRAIALAEGEAEFYAMRVNLLDGLQEVESMLAGPGQEAEVRKTFTERIRRDIDRAIALGSIARARLYDRRAILNAQAGRKEQAIADATRAIEAKEEELSRPRGYYYGQTELFTYYRNRAFRYQDAGQEELAKKDREKARQLEEQAARESRAAQEKEQREFAELRGKTQFFRLSADLEWRWRERALGMKTEDFVRLSPEAQKKRLGPVVRRLRALAKSNKASGEEYLLLSEMDSESSAEERHRFGAKGLELLGAKVKTEEQALFYCARGSMLASSWMARERYDQALAVLERIRKAAEPFLEPQITAADAELKQLLAALHSPGGEGDGTVLLRRLAALDRAQSVRLMWLSLDLDMGRRRAEVYEKLELFGKAREEYQRLCQRLQFEMACRSLERLK